MTGALAVVHCKPRVPTGMDFREQAWLKLLVSLEGISTCPGGLRAVMQGPISVKSSLQV